MAHVSHVGVIGRHGPGGLDHPLEVFVTEAQVMEDLVADRRALEGGTEVRPGPGDRASFPSDSLAFAEASAP